MNTLRRLIVGMLFAAATSAATAEEPSIETITVTAKRHTAPGHRTRTATHGHRDRGFLPTDMPEAEIDYHLTPIGAPPAPAVERATLARRGAARSDAANVRAGRAHPGLTCSKPRRDR